MKRQMKMKLIALLLSIASCLLMFSVGFSTWYNVVLPEGATQASGTVSVYDALTIHNTGMTVFNSSLLSFKTNDQTLTDTDEGVITVNYKIPAETVIATNGTFAVNLELGYSSLAVENHALFATAFSNSFTDNNFSVDLKVGEQTLSLIAAGKSDKLAADDKIVCSKTFTGVGTGSDFEFSVVYTFDIDSGDNFRESFGKYLKGTEGAETTKFAASATVSDIS